MTTEFKSWEVMRSLYMRIGAIFLVGGFLLQIFGSWPS
jgi:hypothetical protein